MSDSRKGGEVTSIRDLPEKSRYVLFLDGYGVGLLSYLDQGDHRVLLHTEVRPEYGGRGLAAELARHVLDDVRAQGRRLVVLCPYVTTFLQKNHEWDELIDQPTPEILAAVDDAHPGRG